jgi:hypothetical protein
MKRIIFISIICIIFASFSFGLSVKGFGGPELKITSLGTGTDMAFLLGGSGGVILNDHFVIGGEGFTTLNKKPIEFSYGAAHVGYLFDLDPWGLELGANIGGATGGLFIVEPEFSLSLKLLSWMQLNVNAGYRFGIKEGIDKSVTGFSGGLFVAFGNFF